MTKDHRINHFDWSPDELRGALEAAGVALWSWQVDTDDLLMDSHGYTLWDVSKVSPLTFERLSDKIHPADRDRVRAAFTATRAVVGPYEIDFRIIVGEDVRWISARGRGNDAGIKDRKMTGIFLDVTGRKNAEESHELLAGEMSHRVKNLLAIASGLTQITSRSSDSVEIMTKQLTGRLTALGRAHDLVRPLPNGQGSAALLGDIITVLLAPYDDDGAFAGRVRVAVPRVGVGETAATGLALVIHELATNALKYGALSLPEGTLDVSGNVVGDNVEIQWTERGGPEVKKPDGPGGYGSKLLHRTLVGHLGGELEHDWSQQGLIVKLKMEASRLSS
ncbi:MULTISPECIES: sensor histidine kinase [unclassified Rhizobium]|uniref:sensor histidine kinase n=1 Tax=unclassified Rhizobium TaxID=2613769 RepID=UPI000713E370|nr:MULTISPECIES: sensor histidine kinase [unclassified Rhizobium]KQS88536.1 histidine kinase [Rhizobium sp. Leaf386]KQS95770.1 histidine kinase [Rhizobium sp. Leaf391]KQU05970.1 histidine kinase [Rhizobium sp. Leaf453]